MAVINRVRTNGWNSLESPSPEEMTAVETNMAVLEPRFALNYWMVPQEFPDLDGIPHPDVNDVAYGKLTNAPYPAYYTAGVRYAFDSTDGHSARTFDGFLWENLESTNPAQPLLSIAIGNGVALAAVNQILSSNNKCVSADGSTSPFWTERILYTTNTSGDVCTNVFFSKIWERFYVSATDERIMVSQDAISVQDVVISGTGSGAFGDFAEDDTVVMAAGDSDYFFRTGTGPSSWGSGSYIDAPTTGKTWHLVYNEHWKAFVAISTDGEVWWSIDRGDNWTESTVTTYPEVSVQCDDLATLGCALVMLDNAITAPITLLVSEDLGVTWRRLPTYDDGDPPALIVSVDGRIFVGHDAPTATVKRYSMSRKVTTEAVYF